MTVDRKNIARRGVLGLGASALATAALGQSVFPNNTTEMEKSPASARNNISSFRMLNWQNYFPDTRNGAVLVDITSRALHFWSEDQSIYRLYPTSVPLSDELTRKGQTKVIEKVVAPPWRPTPEMKIRHPEWPDQVAGGEFIAQAGGPPTQVLIDSSAVKAHRSAAGGKGGRKIRRSAARAAGAQPRSTR